MSKWLRGQRPIIRILLIGWLALSLIGEGFSLSQPKRFIEVPSQPTDDIVQLRCATLPSVLRVIAVHCWFITFDQNEGGWQRWEVWPTLDAGGTSWGHVYNNLMPPDSGTGGGPYRPQAEWRGVAARQIISVLSEPTQYPYHNSYRAWPGPNSNTYVAWILRQSKTCGDLHPMAIGKDYLGIVGIGVSTTQTGIQVETPLLGVKIGLLDGVEIHLLGLTLGLDIWPPATKTPFGRVGFS
jgi:hypothetical protein